MVTLCKLLVLCIIGCLLVRLTLFRPIIQSERETAVKVSRQEQRHVGRGFLPYHTVRSALWPSQITSKPISASILSPSKPLSPALFVPTWHSRQLKKGIWKNKLRMCHHDLSMFDSFICVCSWWQIMLFSRSLITVCLPLKKLMLSRQFVVCVIGKEHPPGLSHYILHQYKWGLLLR